MLVPAVSVTAGTRVTVGAVRSTVMVLAAIVAFGLPAASARAPPVIVSSTVPAVVEEPETVTVYGPVPVPVRPVTFQPVAVPPMLKLPVVRPVTASLRVSEYVMVVAFVGVVAVKAVAVGAVLSIVIVAPFSAAAGAVLPMASATPPAARIGYSVPSTGAVPVSVTVYGPLPLTLATVQPVAVPPTLKSAVVRPVTVSESVRVQTTLVPFVGVDGPVNEVTVGAVPSTATAPVVGVGVPLTTLPARSATRLPSSCRVSVPSTAVGALRVTVYGPAPAPLTLSTVQPVEVPPTVKAEAVTPETDSLRSNEQLTLAVRVLDGQMKVDTVGAVVSIAIVAAAAIEPAAPGAGNARLTAALPARSVMAPPFSCSAVVDA